MKQFQASAYLVQYLMQRLAVAVFALAALGLLAATILAAMGIWSWIEIPVVLNGAPLENAGMYAQIGLTALALGLCFFLPSNRRIMQLENSHRSFTIGMQDVARAYAAVHSADRAATFKMSSEFDAIRERLAYLRDHPDLSTLEPQVLEAAAQMSYISKELATVYADEKIERARSFLTERQAEVNLFNERLDQAKGISTEMKQWLHEVELEESVASAQLERLREEMREIMPELGVETIVRTDREPGKYTADPLQIENTVIEMPPKAAE